MAASSSADDSSGSAPAARRPRVPAAERRTQLLDVAARILLDQGPERVTLQRVAQVAEVNQAIIYRFFDNRDGLLLELCEREAGRYEEALRAKVRSATTFEERIGALAHSYLDERLSTESTIELRVASGPIRSDALRAWRLQRDALRAAFIADQFRDAFPALSAPDAVILAGVLAAGIEGVVRLADAGTPRSLLEARYVAMCVGAATEVIARATVTTD